jgi:formylglycine-generating enzyme required for sulfatase activity
MITTIRHLRDPERTAGLLHEALKRRLLAPDDLRRLLHEDPTSRDWAPLLATEVRADLASPLPAVADRAETLLQVLASDAPRAAASGADNARPATVTVDDLPERRGRWRYFTAAILIVTLIALVVAARLAATPAATISVAAGDYPVRVADGSRVLVALEAFDMDRTEVTRGAWAGCVERGGCAPLAEPLPGTPPTSDRLPVAGVTQAEAAAYCTTLGKRLPTAAEWEVAASWAPRTQRAWRWPWGDVFEPAFVIGAGAEGSAAVGSRSPQGDSPLGAADMAGNVAEWTATLSGDPPGVQVRGGSWRSSADALRTDAVELLPADSRLPTLGFRCAASPAQ